MFTLYIRILLHAIELSDHLVEFIVDLLSYELQTIIIYISSIKKILSVNKEDKKKVNSLSTINNITPFERKILHTGFQR